MPGSEPGAPRNYRDGTPELPGWSPGATGASQRILQAFFDQIWAELLAKTTLPAPRWTYLSRARRFVRSTLNYPTRRQAGALPMIPGTLWGPLGLPLPPFWSFWTTLLGNCCRLLGYLY